MCNACWYLQACSTIGHDALAFSVLSTRPPTFLPPTLYTTLTLPHSLLSISHLLNILPSVLLLSSTISLFRVSIDNGDWIIIHVFYIILISVFESTHKTCSVPIEAIRFLVLCCRELA